jgi:hypothetical protein
MRCRLEVGMKTTWAELILLAAIATGAVEAAEEMQVDVYTLQNDWSRPSALAKTRVTAIFEKIAIRVVWHPAMWSMLPGSGRMEIGIRMVERAPAGVPAGAMAYAHPFGASGRTIVLYQDRIERLLKRLPAAANMLLAYVFAHELAHVMQGLDRHSESGIMSAFWSPSDAAAMCANRLSFSPTDVNLIRDGVTARLASR